MDSTEDHPVWCVYNRLRTVRLNFKYYSHKLHTTEVILFCMDVLLSITVPSSAVAGLFFWESPMGIVVWKYLSVASAFVAVIKPISGLSKKRHIYQELKIRYKTIEFDLCTIKDNIQTKKRYDENLQNDYNQALGKIRDIISLDPDSNENKKLLKILENEVINELPVDDFYIPEEILNVR